MSYFIFVNTLVECIAVKVPNNNIIQLNLFLLKDFQQLNQFRFNPEKKTYGKYKFQSILVYMKPYEVKKISVFILFQIMMFTGFKSNGIKQKN